MPASGSAIGSGLGTAAGAYLGGPMGASVGGALGGMVGGMFDSAPSTPLMPNLATPQSIGAVTGTYGSAYVNPITGQVTYASNTATPSMSSLANQNLMNQLMGYGSVTGADLSGQIAQEQALIDRLKAQGVGTTSLGKYIDPKSGWINQQTGEFQDFDASKLGPDNPLWTEYIRSTGGRYGHGGFAQWAKDDYAKNVAPALQSMKNDQKVLEGNKFAYDQQLAQEQAKLASLQSAQQQFAPQTQNPMLSYLQNGPDQSNYLQNQITQQYKNQQLANQQAMAKRGMGSSAMNELAQGANRNALSQGILGAQIQAGQQNYNNRLQMLNYLTGQNAQALQAETSRGGLYNQQMGQGQQVGQNWASGLTNQQATNTQLGWQGAMANQQAQNAQQTSRNNLWGSAMNALGANSGNIANWLGNQNRMDTNSGAGMTQGAYNYWNQPGTPAYVPYPTRG